MLLNPSLLLFWNELLRRGLIRFLVYFVALLLPVARGSMVVFSPPFPVMVTMMASFDASPKGGSHWGGPITLANLSESRIADTGRRTWERWGWMILYSHPKSSRSDQVRLMARTPTLELNDIAVVVGFTRLPSWSHRATMDARMNCSTQGGGRKNGCGSSGWVYILMAIMPRVVGSVTAHAAIEQWIATTFVSLRRRVNRD